MIAIAGLVVFDKILTLVEVIDRLGITDDSGRNGVAKGPLVADFVEKLFE